MCSDSLRTGYRRGPPSFLRPLLPNAFHAGWCSYQPFDVNSSGFEIIISECCPVSYRTLFYQDRVVKVDSEGKSNSFE